MANNLTLLAKNLRKNSTETERQLWKHLRTKQLKGLKFKRQQPFGKYIVDFICFEKKIIIELDGSQHMEQEAKENDRARDLWFKEQGYTVLRFWDNEVLMNTKGVLEVIMAHG